MIDCDALFIQLQYSWYFCYYNNAQIGLVIISDITRVYVDNDDLLVAT